MQYEDFIYDFVRLLKSWGVWRGVKILYGDKLYKTCDENEGSFRDITYVKVTEMNNNDSICGGDYYGEERRFL